MSVSNDVVLNVNGTIFKSNKASLGGAAYVIAVTDTPTVFRDCYFEENIAADGGAVYLNTALAVDIFSGSVFRKNSAGESVTTSSVCRMDRCSVVKYG